MKCEDRDLTNTAQNRIGQWLTLMKTAPTLHHLPNCYIYEHGARLVEADVMVSSWLTCVLELCCELCNVMVTNNGLPSSWA